MLFVDDGEAEAMKLGVVGEEGVSADEQIDIALSDLFFEGGLVFGGAGEKS